MAKEEKVVTETPEVTSEDATAETTEQAAEKPKPKARSKKKARRLISRGHVHVLATFNNTIITVTDEKGNVLVSTSAGSSGFRGSKKGTAYAAQVAAEKAVSTAKDNFGLTQAEVSVSGIGLGREAAIRTLINQKIQVDSIKDVTGVPHGGVRQRKAKRN